MSKSKLDVEQLLLDIMDSEMDLMDEIDGVKEGIGGFVTSVDFQNLKLEFDEFKLNIEGIEERLRDHDALHKNMLKSNSWGFVGKDKEDLIIFKSGVGVLVKIEIENVKAICLQDFSVVGFETAKKDVDGLEISESLVVWMSENYNNKFKKLVESNNTEAENNLIVLNDENVFLNALNDFPDSEVKQAELCECLGWEEKRFEAVKSKLVLTKKKIKEFRKERGGVFWLKRL